MEERRGEVAVFVNKAAKNHDQRPIKCCICDVNNSRLTKHSADHFHFYIIYFLSVLWSRCPNLLKHTYCLISC